VNSTVHVTRQRPRGHTHIRTPAADLQLGSNHASRELPVAARVTWKQIEQGMRLDAVSIGEQL
jgi:hypothetical protein